MIDLIEKSWSFVSHYLTAIDRSHKATTWLNIIAGVLLAVSPFLQAKTGIADWLENLLFITGVVLFVLSSIFRLFIDSSPAKQLLTLHKSEEKIAELEEAELFAVSSRELVISWLTLTKLLQEVVDQALAADAISPEEKKRLFRMAVEFIAEYKQRLFGMLDDYMNVSVYEFDVDEQMLHCIACYRSRPSDAEGHHRSWRPGTGHVGKAFEMQAELICGDARHPDVAAWIAAPPDQLKDEDIDRYVSLASIPIALTADQPIGVLIMTSDQPGRFRNGSEDDALDSEARIAVDALQDVASQLAQLMHLAQTKAKQSED